jgi:hypothetical protein
VQPPYYFHTFQQDTVSIPRILVEIWFSAGEIVPGRGTDKMLRQVAIRRVFQAVGIFSSLEDNEEETDMEEQDLDSRNVDDGNDRLKVRWFSEIPRCSVRLFCLIMARESQHLRMNIDFAI